MTQPLSDSAFETTMERAIDHLPEGFKKRLENVVFMLAPWPDEATLTMMECDTPYDLLGLYEGCPLPERGGDYAGVLPDTIHLYREPILAYCQTHDILVEDCIVDTVVHEVGHYYGLSDDEMDQIEAECGPFCRTPPTRPPSGS